MTAFIIIVLALLGALTIFTLVRVRELDYRIDDIYNKAFVMQGDIEENRAHLNAHYTDMAQLNADIEKVANRVSELHKHEHADASAKEVEAELENLIKKDEEDDAPSNIFSELDQRRIDYTKYRKQGMDIKSAGVAIGVSYATAKRYEQWRKANKK